MRVKEAYSFILGAHQSWDTLPRTKDENGSGVGRTDVYSIQSCDDEVMVVYCDVHPGKAGTVDEAKLFGGGDIANMMLLLVHGLYNNGGRAPVVRFDRWDQKLPCL